MTLPSLVWVIGQGGLLGSALRRTMSQEQGYQVWEPATLVQCSWNDPIRLEQEWKAMLSAFLEEARRNVQPWTILWAAGASTIAAPNAQFEQETASWNTLLHLLDEALVMPSPRGMLFFSSSAGSIYGNAYRAAFTEQSPCHPLSTYGRHKLLQESALHTWAVGHPTVSCLIGRISTLYGPRQNLHKAQGIISHMSRCIIHRQPIHIYVPLDTIRDYYHADDCAKQIVLCLNRLQEIPGGSVITKILASEQVTSLAQIVGVFATITKKHPQIICSATSLRTQHPRLIRFRSTQWPELRVTPIALIDGIARIHRHQGLLYAAGQMQQIASPAR